MHKHTAPPSGRSSAIALLARDLDGRSTGLSDGGVGWRIRRHAGGTPQLALDEGRQPMQPPLARPLVDVDELLPPGTYRLDAIDDEGTRVAVTVPIQAIAMARRSFRKARPLQIAPPAAPPSHEDDDDDDDEDEDEDEDDDWDQDEDEDEDEDEGPMIPAVAAHARELPGAVRAASLEQTDPTRRSPRC